MQAIRFIHSNVINLAYKLQSLSSPPELARE